MNIQSIYYYTTTFETTEKQKDFEAKSNYETTKTIRNDLIHCKLTSYTNDFYKFNLNNHIYYCSKTCKNGKCKLGGKKYYFNKNGSYLTLKLINE